MGVYLCIYDPGVAYRKTQSFDDRVPRSETSVAFGDTVTAEQVEGDWITLKYDYCLLWLPVMSEDGVKFFEPVSSDDPLALLREVLELREKLAASRKQLQEKLAASRKKDCCNKAL